MLSHRFQKLTASSFFLPLIIFTLSFISFFNILTNQLFYDDEELIYKNFYVQNISNIGKYFSENMIAGAGKTSNMYRPLLLTSFAIDYLIWKTNPLGYHLTSILLHGINGVLLYALLYRLFGKKFIAFLASILFIIHPVQTETIAYASGRTDPLYVFFLLLSLLCFLQFIYKTKYKIIYYSLSLLFFILSLLSKETAIIIPLLISLCSLCHPKPVNLRKFILFISPFITIACVYILLRFTVLNFGGISSFYPVANIYSQSLFVRFFTFAQAFFQYLGVLLIPIDLIFARKISYITTPLTIYVIGFIALSLGVLLFSLKRYRGNKLYLFFFLWFMITILPVSGIIAINSILSEHFLYLPSVGFFLVLSWLLYKIFHQTQTNITARVSLLIGIVIFIVLLFIRTIIRNTDWSDPVTFYTRSITQSPWHITMRHNLAMTYADLGQNTKAIEGYQQVIALADVYPNSHHNLANIYRKQKKYDLAEKEYYKALAIDPNFTFSYYALLELHKETNDDAKYQMVFRKLQTIQNNK